MIQDFIDADGHIVESDTELLPFLPEPFKRREDLLSFPFFPTLDGFHRQARRVADETASPTSLPRYSYIASGESS